MDISEQSHEVIPIVYRFASESVLKKVPHPIVFVVVILRIRNCKAFDGFRKTSIVILDKQMYVIRHKTISIKAAMRLYRMIRFIPWMT
jgi:hypothetical protein